LIFSSETVPQLLEKVKYHVRVMTTKRYDQYCAMARGLDVVGDRWTLLIVRELLTGPKRYGELAAGLPGIATNLLADRLRTLDAAGVVERVPGSGSARGGPYRLTSWGAELESVLLALARWASPLLGPPRPDDTYRLRWLLLTLQAQFDPVAAADLQRTYEFRIGDEVVHVRVAVGTAAPAEGPAPRADVVVAGAPATFLAWGTGQLSSTAAVDAGLAVLDHDGRPHPDAATALDDVRRIFGGTV
jgi:DNA-binding HxlR family transcriptional regulator